MAGRAAAPTSPGDGATTHSRRATGPPGDEVVSDSALLDAAVTVLTEHGYRGLTMERLAARAGSSRMTLHRRGVHVRSVVQGLTLRAADELQRALFPVLTRHGSGAERLEQALRVMFRVADGHLALLAGLFADDAGVFHAEPDPDGALPTHEVFVAPLVRLLRDGAADGSLRQQPDVVETATVLFNTASWGYVQLRHAQRWPEPRAVDAVLDLVLHGLLDARPGKAPDSAATS